MKPFFSRLMSASALAIITTAQIAAVSPSMAQSGYAYEQVKYQEHPDGSMTVTEVLETGKVRITRFNPEGKLISDREVDPKEPEEDKGDDGTKFIDDGNCPLFMLC